MRTIPDFTQYGYQVIKELGRNLEGGRFTYLAQRLADQRQVVVKQFQFAKGSGWDGFGAIEKEIKSLQGLNHRGIPKYLDKLETSDSFCIITEYFAADTLAVARSFTPDEIKRISVQLLEILVYLQERMPPVIHRDIKPENILVDDNLNVYLIDFGFARVGGGSVAMSSAAAGTFGFMAPEQIRNLKLSNASDLYGLGLTMICLIGAIRSIDIGNYIDFSNQLDRSKVDPKLKGCSLTFVKWLDQIVAPDPSNRFANAKTALKGLQPLYVTRYPSVEINKSSLEFKAISLGEKLTQTITLSNSTPETILEGRWEVKPHPNDPPHTPDSHAWISFSPKQFKDNQRECQIIVDTSKLIAQGSGTRNVLLHTNAVPEVYTFPISIVTAPLPLEVKKIPYLAWGLSLATTIPFSYFIILISSNSSKWLDNGGVLFVWSVSWILVSISGFIGGVIGVLIARFVDASDNNINIACFLGLFFGATIGAAFGASSLAGNYPVIQVSVLFGSVASFWIWLFATFGAIISITSYLEIPEAERCHNNFVYTLLCFTIFFGISLGACWQTGLFSNPYLVYMFTQKILSPISYILLLITMISGSLVVLTVVFTLLISPFQRRKKIATYRRTEEHLIKP